MFQTKADAYYVGVKISTLLPQFLLKTTLIIPLHSFSKGHSRKPSKRVGENMLNYFMRKLLFSRAVPVTLVMLLFLNACKKDDPDRNLDLTSENTMVKKVTLWLDEQKAKVNDTKRSNIELLKSNLDFSGIRIESSGEGEKIFIIPVQKGLAEKKNINKNAIPNLVIIFDKMQNIRKCNLVLYLPANGQNEVKVPDNVFYEILNTGKPDCNARLTYLDITGRKLHELEYENERLKAFSNFREDTSSNPKSETVANCIDWFWVTTYYDSEGLILSEDWDYIGTTCEGEDCEDPYLAMLCPMSNNEGGGPAVGYEYTVSKRQYWEVYREQMAQSDVIIKGTLYFFGQKVSTEQQGGHFTGTREATTFTENFSTYQMNWVGVYEQSWHGPQHAYHLVQGNIDYGPYGQPPRYINKTKSWNFIEIFP